MTDNQNTIEFYCDGGCKDGNGYGSFEYTFDGFKNSESRVNFGANQTCNTSEYLALIFGLENFIVAFDYNENVKDMEIHIHSDSKLLVNQINGKWRCKKKHIAPLIERAATLLRRFKSYKVEWNSRRINVQKFGH